MAITVTATEGGQAFRGVLLRVLVLTGQAARPAGNTAALALSAQAGNATIVTTAAGSLVVGALENNAGTGNFTALSGTSLLDNQADSFNGAQYGTCDAQTVTPGAVAVGSSTTISSGTIALAEVLPGTGLAVDSSSPASVLSSTAFAVTTALFTPPYGSLLVALLTGQGAGGASVQAGSVNDTAGLTWTQQVFESAAGRGFSGVWTAPVPPAPVAPATLPQPGTQRILMQAVLALQQFSAAGPGGLPLIQPGQAFWADASQQTQLIQAGQAIYAPLGTVPPPPEPPYTVNATPGLGAGSSNSSH